MKSPFPGMDPFIEGSPDWADFHGHLIEAIYAQLADAAPEGYYVSTSLREYLEVVEQEGDSTDSSKPEKRPAKGGRRGAVATLPDPEPLRLRAFISEAHRERFVEIYKKEEGEPRLVTAIEVLSPANKKPRSQGRRDYLRKRESLLLGDTHLVEIDLLRGGQRMPMADPWPDSPFVLMVSRGELDHVCRVWRGFADRRLPRLPVPLQEPDPDLGVDLQSAIDAIFKRSRYGERLKYDRSLSPPLGDAERTLLASRLKRSKA